MSATGEELLACLFGADLDSPAALAERGRLWFEVVWSWNRERARASAISPARRERPARGRARPAARPPLPSRCLARPAPANLYRGRSRAFAYDGLALEAASAALDAGFDAEVHPLEAGFFYLPFEHAERLDCQSAAWRGSKRSRARSRPPEPTLESWPTSRAGIATDRALGRFPHRNALSVRLPDRRGSARISSRAARGFGGDMQDLRERREATVCASHGGRERPHFETVMSPSPTRATSHPGSVQIHDGDAAVRHYFKDTRGAFPDNATS